MRPPLPAEQRNDARRAFHIAVAQQERMLRLCPYKSWQEHAGELRERINAGLTVAGIDPAELAEVVERCVVIVMRGR
jgi:hypothetical protein